MFVLGVVLLMSSSFGDPLEIFGKPSEAFQNYDRDGDGMIDFKELASLMRGLAGSAGPWEDREVRSLLKAMDSDNDGKVVLTEFGSWLFGSALSFDDESLLKTAELKMGPKSKRGNGGMAIESEGKSYSSEKAGGGWTGVEEEDEEDGEEAEEEEEVEDEEEAGDEENEDEQDEGEDEDDEDEAMDDKEFMKLSQTGRSALWQKLMPAREGSAQDAAEKMKTLKPPNPKRAGDHKHALLYLQNHAGSNTDLIGQAPDGADRETALRWLKDALLKISESHEKSYQLPVKWLIGNYRLWLDEEKDDGFESLKELAIKKLDKIGHKYEAQYVDRKLGEELGFVGKDLEFKVRPRQDHYLKVVGPVAGRFGLKEIPEKELRHLDADERHQHETKKQSSFIVFLLTAVHGVDEIFQQTAKEICESVGGTSRAPPPKGFMRMWAKLDTDHKEAESPRAAENIDTNRVAWIFQEPSQLRDAFEKAMKIFGAPLRVKNGYDLNFNAMAETKGYRNILANYKFSPKLTWGALAKEAKTKTAWENFRSFGQSLGVSHCFAFFCMIVLH